MKGKTSKEASVEAEELLHKLNIYEKRSAMANTLSGGMKRKLCLGMAVIGNSSVSIIFIVFTCLSFQTSSVFQIKIYKVSKNKSSTKI